MKRKDPETSRLKCKHCRYTTTNIFGFAASGTQLLVSMPKRKRASAAKGAVFTRETRRENGGMPSAEESARAPGIEDWRMHPFLRGSANLPSSSEPDILPFSCILRTCPRRFAKTDHILRHYKLVHRRDRPFRCATCNKRFGSNQNLQVHRETCRSEPAVAPDNDEEENEDAA